MKKLTPIFAIAFVIALAFSVQSFVIKKNNSVENTEQRAELPVDPAKKKACKATCKKAKTAETTNMVAGTKDVAKKECTPAQKAACKKAKSAETTNLVAGAKDVADSDTSAKKAKECSKKSACCASKSGEKTADIN